MIFLLALGTLLPLQGDPPTESKLRFGEDRAGLLSEALEAPRSASFELCTDRDGLVTVAAESFDLDVDVLVLDPDGGRLARAARGGLGTDARVSFEGSAGVCYAVVVEAREGTGREFVVRAVRGALPRPQGLELTLAELEYWSEAARRAGERGDLRRAVIGQRAAGQRALDLGRTEEALTFFEAGLALAEQGSWATEATLARAFTGVALARLRRYDEALELLERSRFELEESTLRDREADVLALVSYALGKAYLERGELSTAEEEFEQLRSLASTAGLLAFEAEALGGLAQVEMARGAYASAEARCADRVEVAARLGDAIHADALRQRGILLRDGGELERGRESLVEALGLRLDAVRRGGVLGALGGLEERAGHLALARDRYEEAFAHFDAVGHDYGAAIALQRLAHIAWRLADLPAASEFLERARERADAIDVKVTVWDDVAALRGARGDLAGRVEAHRRALDLAQAAGLVHLEIRARLNLGQALRELGDAAGARDAADTALDMARGCGDRDLEAQAQVNLGYLDLLGENGAGAIERSRRAIDLAGPGETELNALETIARAAIRLGDVEQASRAIDSAEDLLDSGGGPGLTIDETSRWRSRHAWWAETLTADLTQLRLSVVAPGETEYAEIVERGWRAASEWKHRALAQHLSARQRRAAGAVSPIDALVGTGTVLIEYSAGSERIFAYAVTSDRVRHFELGDRAAIEARAGEFVQALATTAPMADVVTLGKQSYADLLEPVLEGLPPDTRALVIVPTAQLAGVPFEALIRADGDAEPSSVEYVIDDFVVAYGPSPQVLARLTRASAPAVAHRAMLLGDPVYAHEREGVSESVRARPDPLGFDRLRATRDEVFEIARLLTVEERAGEQALALLELQSKRSGRMEAPNFTLCLGAEASTDRLAADLSGCSILHIGAHGHVDLDQPGDSGLVLSFRDEDPGFLSVRDVVNLELDLELAVLSACDTARGKIRGGEGVQSIANAFLQAGARSVVASLWQVRDVETSILMRGFYRRYLRDGMSASEALRAAKLEQRHATELRGRAISGASRPAAGHPYYWAACVYVGLPPEQTD